MPEISRFYGILIKMFFADHLPPHFHATYGDDEGLVDIRSLGLLSGSLPPKALGMVIEWASQHQTELMELWELAQSLQPLHRIEPLK